MFNKGCINNAKRPPADTAVKWTGYRFDLPGLLDGGLGADLVSVNEVKLQSLLAMFKSRGYNRVRQGMLLSTVHWSAAGLLVWVSRPCYPLRVL
jgi:hypothetical protein